MIRWTGCQNNPIDVNFHHFQKSLEFLKKNQLTKQRVKMPCPVPYRVNSICKRWVFFDKNEGPCGTLSEQSISCFSHCALCSYRGIGEICKSLERERNLPPVIEHTHSPHTPSLLCFKFSTHSFFMRVSKAPSIPSMFYKKLIIS